jgi:uncharacterized protein YbjT (DUF2867 family)
MTDALIVGASGEVGRQLLQQALDGGRYGTIHLLLRRSMGYREHPLVREHLQNPLEPENLQLTASGVVVFCALGTTRRRAGSKAEFYRVDHDLVLAVGRWAQNNGAAAMHVVSSIGADPRSLNHYVRTKGQTERDLRQLALPSLTIYRPALLDAPGRAEFRPGERLAAQMLAGLKRMPFGWARRWQPVSVSQLAQAMLQRAAQAEPGCHIIESEEL